MITGYLALLIAAVVIVYSLFWFVLGWFYGLRAQVVEEQRRVRAMQAEFLLGVGKRKALQEEGAERSGAI